MDSRCRLILVDIWEAYCSTVGVLVPKILLLDIQVCTVVTTQEWHNFFGKPADINNGWIRYVQVIQLGLIDAASSTLSLSVHHGKSCRTWTSLALVQWPAASICTHVSVPRIQATVAIQKWCLFHSDLLIVWLPYEGSDYSRVATNWRNTIT